MTKLGTITVSKRSIVAAGDHFSIDVSVEGVVAWTIGVPATGNNEADLAECLRRLADNLERAPSAPSWASAARS